jgi:hypothetical protein
MAFGTHPGINQNLRHRIPGSGRGLSLVSRVNRFDEIDRMVVGNKLQRVLDALNDVLFLYGDGQCLNSFVGTSGDLSCLLS